MTASVKSKKKTEVAIVPEAQPLVPMADQPITILNIIAGVIEKPSVNVEKIRALLEMKREEDKERQRVAYNAAMTLAQNEMVPVVRKSENKHTKSKFAKLEKIDEAIRPIYTRHGFNLEFNSQSIDKDTVRVTCECSHREGFTKKFELAGALDMAGAQGTANKTSIQGLGSTVSYLRRYLTCMIFNVVLTDEDNDGNKQDGSQPPKPDKFAQRVAEDAARTAKPVTDVLPEDEEGLKAVATILRARLKAAHTKEARTELMGKNLPLLRKLEEKGLKDVVARLHEVVDREVPND